MNSSSTPSTQRTESSFNKSSIVFRLCVLTTLTGGGITVLGTSYAVFCEFTDLSKSEICSSFVKDDIYLSNDSLSNRIQYNNSDLAEENQGTEIKVHNRSRDVI